MIATIKIGIASHLNCTFRHEIDTMIPVDEWHEFSDWEKDQIIQKALFESVDAWVVNE